jgi:thiamine biosynthesis lipoprotein
LMRKFLPGLIVVASLLACGERMAEHRSTLYVFGTLLEIQIRDKDRALAQRATAELAEQFQRMHREWHAWQPGGELSRLNAAFAAGEAMTAGPFLLPLVLKAREYHRISGGLFDPAVGALVDAWGFHADEPPGGRPPFERILELQARRPTMDDVTINGDRVSSRNPTVRLDFGGFAKGVALDYALAHLRSLGIGDAMLNAGGGLAVLGSHGERPWIAAVRDPGGAGVLATVDLFSGDSLHTSGGYERFREYEGRRYTHIIDPRTGTTAERMASASVIHEDGGLADAAATALMLSTPETWEQVAQSMGIRLALLVDSNGEIYVTPEMKERLHFEGAPPSLHVGAPWGEVGCGSTSGAS